jgi:cation diffusion facilitator family transporter
VKTTSAEHARLLRLATRASLAVACVLIIAKAVAWWMSGSVSLLAGLTDSVMDAAASFLNLLAVHYALKPADEDHRFGHGKAEALAGLAQALFISISALLIGVHAVDRLQHPQPLTAGAVGIAVTLFSLAMTLALLLLQRHVVKLTASTAVRADSLHYASDLLLNGSILLALVLASLGFDRADALFGLAIAVYILWSAFTIVREAVAVLMDQELPLEVTTRMTELVCSVPGVMGAHDLRSRISGSNWHVQLHLELPADMPLIQAHALCDAAEEAIHREFPRTEVLVHADPTHSPADGISSNTPKN